MQRRRGETIEAMICQFQPWMLAGDEQPRCLAESGKGMGNRTQLDGFRTRSDDERDTRLAQLPP